MTPNRILGKDSIGNPKSEVNKVFEAFRIKRNNITFYYEVKDDNCQTPSRQLGISLHDKPCN